MRFISLCFESIHVCLNYVNNNRGAIYKTAFASILLYRQRVEDSCPPHVCKCIEHFAFTPNKYHQVIDDDRRHKKNSVCVNQTLREVEHEANIAHIFI